MQKAVEVDGCGVVFKDFLEKVCMRELCGLCLPLHLCIAGGWYVDYEQRTSTYSPKEKPYV